MSLQNSPGSPGLLKTLEVNGGAKPLPTMSLPSTFTCGLKETNEHKAVNYQGKGCSYQTLESKKGLKKCGECLACSCVKEARVLKARTTKEIHFCRKQEERSYVKVRIQFTYQNNCKKQYIGITHQGLHERIYIHLGNVRNKILSRVNISTLQDIPCTTRNFPFQNKLSLVIPCPTRM